MVKMIPIVRRQNNKAPLCEKLLLIRARVEEAIANKVHPRKKAEPIIKERMMYASHRLYATIVDI